MKYKNSIFSFLRHAASLAGGVLIANPDPRMQALGAVLGALGAGWGVSDEARAENPGMKPPTSTPGIGIVLLCFACAAMCSTFTGCASSPIAHPPGTSAFDPVTVEKNAARIVKIAVIYTLQTEPGAGAELQRISAGVDTVFGRGSLTPEQLNAFLDELKVKPQNRLLLAAALTEAYGLYTELTGQSIPDITHPLAVGILNGVKRGIAEALALQAAVQPAAK